MAIPTGRSLTRTDILSGSEVAELLGIQRSNVPQLARREAQRPPRRDRVRQAENGDSGPLFELLADALPAFALEENDGPSLQRCLEEAGFTVELSEYRDNTERYPDLDTLVRGYW